MFLILAFADLDFSAGILEDSYSKKYLFFPHEIVKISVWMVYTFQVSFPYPVPMAHFAMYIWNAH